MATGRLLNEVDAISEPTATKFDLVALGILPITGVNIGGVDN